MVFHGTSEGFRKLFGGRRYFRMFQGASRSSRGYQGHFMVSYDFVRFQEDYMRS